MELACLDVDYRNGGAQAACVSFQAWTDAIPSRETVCSVDSVPDYQPGEFYLRELPCLLAVLERLPTRPDLLVVDGYVWLGPERPGLGAHLFQAVGLPVIGVAKTAFRCEAAEVYRGESRKPLLVTSQGIEIEAAAKAIESMHGPFRLPTLLKRVDQLCRTVI
jgi:deoxyribonuclease V